jgi:hypothetical protein
MDLKALHPIRFFTEMDPATWGRLLHSYLDRAIRGRGDQTLSQISLDLLAEEKLSGQEGLLLDSDQLWLRILPPPFDSAQSKRLVQVVTAYCRAVAEGSCPDGIPVSHEMQLIGQINGCPNVSISGRLDRIDIRDGQRHVVDYKSGRVPWSSRRWKDLEEGLGFYLQASIYPWLVGLKEGDTSTGFSFLFLGEDPPEEVFCKGRDDVAKLVESLLEVIRQGSFFPTPSEIFQEFGLTGVNSCRGCELASLCRRFEANTAAVVLRHLSEWCQGNSRFSALLGQGGLGG